MNKIDEIFNILVQFEKAQKDEIAFCDYLNYLNKLYIRYYGMDVNEICDYLKGLYKIGKDVKHDTVKRVVFDIIRILERA